MKLQELKEGWKHKDVDFLKTKEEIQQAMRHMIGMALTADYTINSDFTVTVHHEFTVESNPVTRNWHKLPVKFKVVSGNFSCREVGLHSLENCPSTVEGDFLCYDNKLTDLKGGPRIVSGDYNCKNNRLKSLEGSPKDVGDFDCSHNELENLIGGPELIDGKLTCSYNYINSFDGFPEDGINGNLDMLNNALTTLVGIADKVPQIYGQISLALNPITSGGLGLLKIHNLERVNGFGQGKAHDIINKYLGMPDKIFECQTELIEAGYEEYAEL